MTGAESKTPKTPRTPKSTKPWNINIGKVPLDESLNFDFEDEEKTRMCGVKLRSNDMDKWLRIHQDIFNKDFEDGKGTSVLWKTSPGTTSLSVQPDTAQKTGKAILSIHFYSKKKGLMVQGQETKWWAEKLYPEVKKYVNGQDKRTRASVKDGVQSVRDAVDSFTFTSSIQTTSNQPCPTTPETQ